jgi:hypothetical protein
MRAARIVGPAALVPALLVTIGLAVTDPPVAGREPDCGSVYHEGEGSAVHIVAEKAGGTKCDRCWRYVPAVSSAAGREGICPRCEDAWRRPDDRDGHGNTRGGAAPLPRPVRDAPHRGHSGARSADKLLVRLEIPLHDSVTIIPDS